MVSTDVIRNINTERVRGRSPLPANGVCRYPSLVHISVGAVPQLQLGTSDSASIGNVKAFEGACVETSL